jgi:hypothetical protein
MFGDGNAFSELDSRSRPIGKPEEVTNTHWKEIIIMWKREFVPTYIIVRKVSYDF